MSKHKVSKYGNAGIGRVINSYKHNAIARGLPWTLSVDTCAEIFSSNCHYCGAEPSQIRRTANFEFKYNGIDRIDNSKGYEQFNVVPCCFICNRMKNEMSPTAFYRHIHRILNYEEGR